MGSGFEIQILRMSGKQYVLHTENSLSVTGFPSSLVRTVSLADVPGTENRTSRADEP